MDLDTGPSLAEAIGSMPLPEGAVVCSAVVIMQVARVRDGQLVTEPLVRFPLGGESRIKLRGMLAGVMDALRSN
ncbi:hypothetical protein [Kutzneria albida]|uniref:Uncharacterized protein n=1 Tax=Kutzneria albida DSM 43870 TaxID=1449976 RepID=W5WBS1_9PSEU|nr:hypothetical protein [Kutzneria albida]AHH98205.1 hypothetical protein KALB_4843 [Kutzneria albida DSM 43870]